MTARTVCGFHSHEESLQIIDTASMFGFVEKEGL